MPPIPRPHRPRRPTRPARPRRPRRSRIGSRTGPARIVVLGDLMLDVILAPSVPLAHGTDVPGRVRLAQGGSAATTARWLGRLGAQTSLIAAVGRDGAGRALVDAIRADGVTPHVSRIAGAPTGRIGVLVEPSGERSFVADRAAADLLDPRDLRGAWFSGADALHMPIYSLLGEPLGAAGRRAIELARQSNAIVSLDLASIGPLLADGRRVAHALIATIAPDLLFATAAEAEAFLGGRRIDRLLDVTPTAVIKRGPRGATVMTRVGGSGIRFEVATEHLVVSDTTGAGDAFDAGFLVGWFAAQRAGRSLPASLQRAAVVGHRAAARQLTSPRVELALG